MITISNGISFIRAPLALLFLIDSVSIRITAIILAMLTDGIDGYLARKYKSVSKFGAFLDPAMDKFFVYFALGIFIFESKIRVWQAVMMISRDIALCVFGLFLAFTKRWAAYEFQAVRWGKITTALQFCILIGLTISLTFSWVLYSLFVVMAVLAFFELLQTVKKNDNSEIT